MNDNDLIKINTNLRNEIKNYKHIKIEKLESRLNEQDIEDKNMCKKIIKIKNDLLEN
jgi:hypothetical protein